MVGYKYADLYLRDNKDKQLKIDFDSGTITNTNLHSENFELSESICSGEQLRFGNCEASSIKFRISNIITSLKDKWLTVTETLDGNTDVPFSFGEYKVFSDKPTADRRYRDIVAYDAMYDILHAEVSGWYNTILPTADSQVTLKEFRDSFLAHFGIEQEPVGLVNDSMIITKTIEPTSLSGKTVITAICEINGCFGHIGRDGKFKYIFLKDKGLYPAETLYPAEDLYARTGVKPEVISGSYYRSAKYEGYTTAFIDKLQIRQEEDDIGSAAYGTGDNCYIIQDNFLVYGKSDEELQTVAENLYPIISVVSYQPVYVEAKGNPCLEVGDMIELSTRNGTVTSYILQRTLKGIQALRDTYEAEGEQYQAEKVNGIRESIIQLKGKTNKLTRTVEQTRLEIKDVSRNLSSQIKQNAESISLKVSKDSIISEINQTAEQITISASKIDLQGLVSAKEFTSTFATVKQLDAASAKIGNLETEKLSASKFTAANINAMGIVAGSVAAENITGTKISGKTLVGGEIKSNNYVASDSSYACGGGMRIDLINGNIWWANGSIKSTVGVIYSYGYDTFSTDSGYYVNHKNALALYSADKSVMVLGGGFSSVILPSGTAVSSTVEKKENIIPCLNALSAVENTDVYYFNYKNDSVKRDSSQKVGFIIGADYKLDSRLLAETGDAIDTYNAIGLNWRATQQLYEKIKKQQKQIDEIMQALSNQEVA